MRGRSAWQATLLVLAAACGFGSISTLMVVAKGHGLTVASAMALRYGVAAPFLAMVAGLPALRAASTKRIAGLIIIGGLGQVAVSALSLSAIGWLDVATLAFLFYTFPAWVTLISVARGIERLDATKSVALLLALGGLAIIVGRPGALPLPGVARALGAALIYAIYIPTLHWLRGPLSASAASAYVILGTALLFVIGAVVQGDLPAPIDLTAWGVTLVLALFCTVMTFIAFLNGLAVLGPMRTAIISTFEPFWTAMLGAVALAQPVGPLTIVGGLCIAAAVLLLQRQPTAS